jgi:hypothetical protein
MSINTRFTSGSYCTFSVNGAEVACNGWSIAMPSGVASTETSASGRFSQNYLTFQNCSGMLATPYDLNNDPLVAPRALYSGNVVTNLKLFLNQSAASAMDGLNWLITQAGISHLAQAVNTRTVIPMMYQWIIVAGAVVYAPNGEIVS